MAKITLSKNLINSIATQNNEVYIEHTQNLVKEIVSASVLSLAEKISFVTKNNVILQPVNELLNGAFCDNSQFVYFLGIENAQLEINTAKSTNFWRKMLQKFKTAWANRRKRKFKKKKKKNDIDYAKTEPLKIQDMSKYSIYNLATDFQQAIANQVTETSIVYLNSNEISLIGKDDFGANTRIRIYLVNYNSEVFRFYAGKRRGFIDVNITARCDALNDKINNVGENFITLLKIFNVLFYNANNRLPNQVFMESILYSVPNELFEGNDIYNVFIKIVNFLSIKTIKNIASINNANKTIFNDEICGEDAFGFTKMMDFISQHE